jgi:hypothetical protein
MEEIQTFRENTTPSNFPENCFMLTKRYENYLKVKSK